MTAPDLRCFCGPKYPPFDWIDGLLLGVVVAGCIVPIVSRLLLSFVQSWTRRRADRRRAIEREMKQRLEQIRGAP